MNFENLYELGRTPSGKSSVRQVTKEGLHSQTKQHKLRVTRGRVRRPITVEAVPAKAYPSDSRARLRTAAMPFVAHGIRRLIDQGVYEIDQDGNIVLAKERKK